ncbi:GNAT family N-acetyltransferase [Paenibacillus filicis]|uniref:GNAT family N-acetyltransferase n=1 Tax=Paenibacillus gyeongsangnamensis TaxID=3388067 RepID=A0ABT4QAJ1_9BACL|nr:GNAT family N-acetyltransferase [Paenibacillus filicis]MCZ8513853.1 GNAT family N-acetyltransferase [Paenibacillus filicis]
MGIEIRSYQENDASAIELIWNHVIDEGESFLWTEHFSKDKIMEIIKKQDEIYCAIDLESGEVVGFYILHKNYPGRGSHIANALYAVRFDYRKKGIGKMLGNHSIEKSRQCGYRGIQFNSIVSSNTASIRLWESLGFERVGTIKEAFKKSETQFVDLYVYFRRL